MSLNNWQPVIGLEVHVQLATRTKLFSSSPIAFGADPNTQASEIDLGLPGVLPVLNKEAISHALKFGCAINAEISEKVILTFIKILFLLSVLDSILGIAIIFSFSLNFFSHSID